MNGTLTSLALLVSCLAAASPQQPQWQDVVKAATPAVVVVETEKGQGSGFVVRSDGLFITNHHVVASAKQLAVHTSSGEIFRGGFIMALDESRDLAVVRVEGFDLPIVQLGNSNAIDVGMPVLLLGAPRGLEQSASDGIVAGTRTDDNGTKLIQTSAAASPGSSGGPLLNRDGQVIGVLSFTLTQSQNLNFAIPINYARGILDRLIAVAAQPVARLEPLVATDAARSAVPTAASTPSSTARTREEAFLSSKTIYILSRDLRLQAGATSQLTRWGRYTEVALPDKADLILRLEVTWENQVGGGKASAQLVDRQSAQVLWSGSRGGAFTEIEKAGRQVIEDLQKAYQQIEPSQSRRK